MKLTSSYFIAFTCFILLCLSSTHALAGGANAVPRCGPESRPVIDSATTLSGPAAIKTTEEGMLVVAISASGDRTATQVFRIAVADPTGLSSAFLNRRKGQTSELMLIDRQGLHYRELELIAVDEPALDARFYVDARQCKPLPPETLLQQAASGIHATLGIALAEDPNGLDLETAINDHSAVPVIRHEPEENTLSSPFLCVSGGPHATSCSVSFGSIGPVGLGTCSITCPPPTYACCGLGFGSNCGCIMPDGDLPFDPPPSPPSDPGGGSEGGGSDGGESGGGGTDPIVPGPGPGDDDDDDGPGEDEGYCLNC
jgi:hypothetical protein